MKHIEDILDELAEKHPKAIAALYFAVALVLLIALVWFLLFSGLNTSADFVYNQF